MLHGTLDQVRDPVPANRRQDVERINYDENINSRLIVRGFGGNDYFAADDNAPITTLDGGAGDDTFQIGQIYGSPRISAPDPDPASVAAGDDFGTVETTAGFLSRGATFGITAYGGTGNDRSRSTATRPSCAWRATTATTSSWCAPSRWRAATACRPRATTEATGGEGDDTIQYNVNAPVDLDGGAGFDKVIVHRHRVRRQLRHHRRRRVRRRPQRHATTTSRRSRSTAWKATTTSSSRAPAQAWSPPSSAAWAATPSTSPATSPTAPSSARTSRAAAASSTTRSSASDATDPAYDGLLAPGIDLNVAERAAPARS